METRRVRRLEHRRTRRVIVVATSICALGFGAGMSLPRNTAVAVLVTATAAASLALVWARADRRARSHALTHVVRLSAKGAATATWDSWRSRVGGTARAVRDRLWSSTPAVDDDVDREEDDEHFWHFDVRTTDAAPGA